MLSKKYTPLFIAEFGILLVVIGAIIRQSVLIFAGVFILAATASATLAIFYRLPRKPQQPPANTGKTVGYQDEFARKF